MPEGRTPFTEWPWLEFEEFAMSMSILVEDRILTIQSATSGNDVWSSLRLRELRKLLEAQGAMRASRAYREVIVSARARCH